MTTPDERISAYLDGAMTGEEAAAFEADVGNDPALAERLVRWQGNDAMLRAGFEAAPVDDALVRRLALGPVAQSRSAEIVDLAARRRKPQTRDAGPRPDRRVWAAAAAVLLIAGLAIPALLGGGSETRDLADSGAFQTALSELPSNKSAKLEDGSALTPVLSFAAADGRFCREFRHDESARSREGIACRDRSWKIEGIAVAEAPADGGGIQTAGGSGSAALDAVYGRLNPSDPFGADDEQRHIEDGWVADRKNSGSEE